MDIGYDFICDAFDLPKDSLLNQYAVFYTILGVGGTLFYLFTAGFAYFYYFYWKAARYFPDTINVKELHKQAIHEIYIAVCSIPLMAVLMVHPSVASYRGYSMIYKDINEYGGLPYVAVSIVLFFLFTDCLVYWAHRGLHHPLIYKTIHKPHHTYRYTTPFSSHAFHPIDGFGQGVPYCIATFFIPMHDIVYLCMFVIINCWTVMIHDQVDFGETRLINSTGHHTIHHVEFNYNYGQYTTLWDRIGGTYKPAVKTHRLPHSIAEIVSDERIEKLKEE